MTSRSIVLDIDRSQSLAKEFWKSIESSAQSYLQEHNLQPTFQNRFANTIVYYNKESISRKSSWSDVISCLSDLSVDSSTKCFDHCIFPRLVEYGVELPPNTIIEKDAFDSGIIGDALKLISLAWPAAFQEIQAYVAGIIVMANEDLQGKTAPTWFGALFMGHPVIRTGNIRAVATSIIHEVGHLALFAQSSLESPLTDPNKEFYSAFKKRNRPGIMVLHAQIALARMLLWLHSLDLFISSSSVSDDLKLKVPTDSLRKVTKMHTETYLEGMLHVRNLPFSESGHEIFQDFCAIETLLRRT